MTIFLHHLRCHLPAVAGAAAAQSLTAGSYTLDSTGAGVALQGNGRLCPMLLDTEAGVALRFQLQLPSETHSSANHAGHSVVLVDNNPSHALALAFWSDHVRAQTSDAAEANRFVHGQDAARDSTSTLRSHSVLLQHHRFTLSSGGIALLQGTWVDPSAAGLPDSMRKFLLFGGNSSRGCAGRGGGHAVPEPGGWVAAGGGVGGGVGSGVGSVSATQGRRTVAKPVRRWRSKHAMATALAANCGRLRPIAPDNAMLAHKPESAGQRHPLHRQQQKRIPLCPSPPAAASGRRAAPAGAAGAPAWGW